MDLARLIRTVQDKIYLDLDQAKNIKSAHNNWVVPGFVMAGPFPGVDGANYMTIDDACININNIIDDGIDTFINLCGELPTDGSTPNHCYFPKYTSYTEIITSKLKKSNITFFHFPIIDQQPASESNLITIVSTIISLLAEKHKVFIHCAGGHGRTGMVVACLLQCLYKQMNLYNSLYWTQYLHNLRRKQDARCAHLVVPVSSPNTQSQFQLVADFATFLRFLR